MMEQGMTPEELKKAVYDFIDLWQRLSHYDLDITFEDGETHGIYDLVEICWNHDQVTECFNPVI